MIEWRESCAGRGTETHDEPGGFGKLVAVVEQPCQAGNTAKRRP
ncbi:hypothetical protein RAN7_2085 [plant metagenome]|uniref:Uncharacterized protein n=1 Tax=plant metagenome TaxID=1297885 RepID=A0A484YD90_9ZZZZ